MTIRTQSNEKKEMKRNEGKETSFFYFCSFLCDFVLYFSSTSYVCSFFILHAIKINEPT